MTQIKKIPKFKSYKEEADFWDNHDATDYFNRNSNVTLDFTKTKKRKESVLNIRLQPQFKAKLNSLAEDKGIQVSTLARMWLLEKLKSLSTT